MSVNARLAGTTLGHLTGLGVSEFVVCAGARNAPLVTSLLATCREKGLKVYHHFDERSAAFFALGLAKRSAKPVAVLTTSGTAVAELLPATIEAYYSGLPLILVTADRPASYRGSGAPQAIEQAGIFGPYAFALDVSDPAELARIAEWPRDAALHLNLCFDEPQATDRNASWKRERPHVPLNGVKVAGHANLPASAVSSFCGDREGLLVLLGEIEESWREEVERFLVMLSVPVWAEATSGLRESAALGGQIVFGEPGLPKKVLRIGGVPSLRLWRDLEMNALIPVLSICRRPFSGLARSSELVVTDQFPRVSLVTREGQFDGMTVLDEAIFAGHPSSEPALVRELSRQIPSAALVYLGNSLPIREWNLAAVRDSPHPRCYASRGANGIDGQIATFLGLSEGEGEAWGIVGDLTALYDLNAPAVLDQLSPGRRRLVILNNGGGRIFSRLPSMAGLSEPHKQVTENRHSRRFKNWTAMWDLGYVCWFAGDPFPDINGETVVIEVIPDNGETEAFWEARK